MKNRNFSLLLLLSIVTALFFSCATDPANKDKGDGTPAVVNPLLGKWEYVSSNPHYTCIVNYKANTIETEFRNTSPNNFGRYRGVFDSQSYTITGNVGYYDTSVKKIGLSYYAENGDFLEKVEQDIFHVKFEFVIDGDTLTTTAYRTLEATEGDKNVFKRVK